MEPVTQVTVNGKVTGADDAPLSGVAVTVKGTNNSVTTNSSGNYTISVGPEAKVLLFSLKGMKPVEEPIAGRTVINVMMEPEKVKSSGNEKGCRRGHGGQWGGGRSI